MRRGTLLVAILILVTNAIVTRASDSLHEQPALRRPVALVGIDDQLCIANRRSGTVSIVDPHSRSVLSETAIGKTLADIAAIPGTHNLVVVDEQQDELLLVEKHDATLRIVGRTAVPRAPVNVVVTNDSRTVIVTSLWARTVTFASLNNESAALTVQGTINLPFEPRHQLLLAGDSKLIVADAFQGRLAVVDSTTRTLLTVRDFEGHNISGLSLAHDGHELLVAHQTLDSNAPTTHDNIFWGGVIASTIRTLPLRDLLSADGGPISGYNHRLGRPSEGAGDPGDILTTSAGQTIVTLAGVNEVAFRLRPVEPYIRRYTPRQPVALAASPDERSIYLANKFDDSISILDMGELKIVATIPLGPQPELNLADRGEVLFHDAHLSLDGWFSCHSCHTDGHTTGLLSDNFGDDSYGAPKRIPTLYGARETAPWAWNGASHSISDQVRKSITSTMQGEDVADDNVEAIAAYLQALEPISTASMQNSNSTLRDKGQAIFERQGCANCHVPPLYTSSGTYDVSIKDELGRTEFNPPSLRGVRYRHQLFHDNRAASLHDAFTVVKHGLEQPLSEEEVRELIAFLEGL